MNQKRFARLLIQPSAMGVVGILGISIITMVLAGVLYLSKTGLLYEYLFGADSSAQLIETSKSTIEVFNETVFGNPLLNKILFFVFWMVTGLVVYIFLTGAGSSIGSAEQAVEESGFVHAQKGRIRSELVLKSLLVIIAFGLNVIFVVLYFKILLPFGVLCTRIIAGNPGEVSSWFYGILGFVVLVCTYYLGMVLLRFLLLRPRIFGGQEDILADELDHNSNLNNDSTT